uniref:Centrosomal protein of n=1 Tax=Schistocephalus solidus TaxID=70667 RepID=A0A183SR16_SCHSO
LVLEIERLKRLTGTRGQKMAGKRISQLDEHIAGIEQDRDYWRSQVELLTHMLACSSLVGKNGSSKQLSKSTSEKALRSGSLTSKTRRDTQKAKMEEEIKQLRAERDALKSHLSSQRIHAEHRSTGLPRAQSLNRMKSCEEAHENQKLRLERDELQLMLNRLETRVQEARNEIHRLHHDLYDAHNCGDRNSTAQQELLSRLESGNEHAQAEISRLTAERDSVVTKYKKILELESQDKLRHNKQMDYLEKALSEATAERDEVMGRVNGLRRKLEDLQCHQVQIEQKLTEKQEKLKRANEEVADLRQEVDVKQRRIDEVEGRMNSLKMQLADLENAFGRSESRADENAQRLQMEREETARLQFQIDTMTTERDKLQQELEEIFQAKTNLQKQNKYLEKKYLSAVCERDEAATDCSKLNGELKDAEKRLHDFEADASAWASKYQELLVLVYTPVALYVIKLEKATNETLMERCSVTERRLESAEMRAENGAEQLRKSQDAAHQLELQLKSQLEQLDWLKSSVDRLTQENANLRNTVELANKDKLKLESCIEELTTANRQLARDRDDLTHRHSMSRERAAELEAENRALDAEVKRNVETLRNERGASADLRQHYENNKQRCELLEREVSDLMAKLRDAEERMRQVETRCGQLECELRLEHDDYLQIRARTEAIEDQRDSLELHPKNAFISCPLKANLKVVNQRLADLEVERSAQSKEVKEALAASEEAARTLARKDEQVQMLQAEQQSLRSELAAAQSSLRDSRREAESADREVSRCRDEIAALNRDLHRLQSSLRETIDERNDMKQRLEEYLNEIARLERIMTERDRERELLSEQLRAANEDAEIWRSRWEKSEGSISAIRAECEEREIEVARLRDALESKERELSQCRSDLTAAEARAASTSKAAYESNENARLARSEIDALTMEISRLREAVARAEASKAAADRESTHCQIDVEQLRAQLDDNEAELARLKDQLATERENSRNLRVLLQSSKEKEHIVAMDAQEKTNEIILLRERAVNAEERAESQQREVERLYERLSETEREATRLSRSLSTERFEKERMLSEIRLTNMPTPYRPSPYTAS